ncbi:substrate-binding periplasmic protein [Pseudodesulfovibrio profundus]|nr:transporter substrate-binding domain-containing protein [Pseudodesulfovibrio profundus]
MLRHIPAAIMVLLFTVSSAQAEAFTVFTNTVPPIKFVENNRLKGVAGEILDALLRRTNHSVDTVIALPLKTAYEQVRQTKNSICPALGRTPQREKHFKWVGPVYSTRFGLIVKKSRLEELKSVNSSDLIVGSVAQSVPEQKYRKQFPSKKVRQIPTTDQAIRQLAGNTIDVLVFALTPAFHLIAHEGLDPHDYVVLNEIDSVDLYIAFNLHTSDQTIQQFQDALEDMKRSDDNDNEYKRIISRYFVPSL